MSTAAALAYIAVLSVAGTVMLRTTLRWLGPLEVLAYGPIAGMVLGSVLILGLATPIGLLAGTVTVGVFAAFGCLFFWPQTSGTGVRRQAVAFLGRVGVQVGWGAAVVMGLLALRFAILWGSALTVEPDGLWAGHEYIWSDWTLHLGDTTSFAYTDNFPPTHPRLADSPVAYHYLISITAAAMVSLGVDPVVALPLQSFFLSIGLLLVLFAFIQRLSGDRAVAALGLVLFILGGSLGWLLLFDGTAGSPFQALVTAPWDGGEQHAAGFHWLNPYFALIMSQRAALYGIPIVLLILTIVLHGSVERGRWRDWAAAGLLAGVLPLAHISGLAALGLIVPGLIVLFPRREWLAFVATGAIVGGIVLFGVQGGEARASSSLRWEPGWLTGDDAWLWFWVRNLGLYLPLAAVGWLVGGLLSGPSRRLLLAFVPIFVVANTFILGAYDWDNSKVLLYFFLALAICSAVALVALWRVQRDVVSRALIVVAVLTMIGSGLLTNLSQLRGNDRMRLAGPAELDLAAWAREETPIDAVFAVGLEHNDPIPMLAGRRVIASYPPWLTNLGLDPTRQVAALRSIMRLDPAASELIAAYGVDYVAIGPWEIDELDADVEAFAARYPIAYESGGYRVFDVAP